MAVTTSDLGLLLEAVTRELMEQVQGFERPMFDKDGAAIVDKEGQPVMEHVRPTPAVLTCAITLLKNNNISADAVKNEALRDLQASLEKRRKRGGAVTEQEFNEAALAFAQTHGGIMQ